MQAKSAINLIPMPAVAGQASSVEHEALIRTSVLKYHEKPGLGWQTPKVSVEQQEEKAEDEEAEPTSANDRNATKRKIDLAQVGIQFVVKS